MQRRLILGAPVANRAWALPAWFDHLAAQSRPPDGVVFVHSGHRGDETWEALRHGAALLGLDHVRVVHDPAPAHERGDPARYATLARLRNRLLAEARLFENPDVFVSLDSDVLLTDPSTLENLEGHLHAGADTASPVLWLASDHQPDSEAYNAGWWATTDTGSGDRAFYRRPVAAIPWGETVQIDVPMAAVAMNRRVLDRCRYRWHECGEDLGFAQDLDLIGARCVWDTTLVAKHVWSQAELPA